jgi:hypothetical protein
MQIVLHPDKRNHRYSPTIRHTVWLLFDTFSELFENQS